MSLAIDPVDLPVRLRPAVWRRWLLGLPWILSAAGLAVELAARRTPDPELYGFLRLFSLSQEGNLPTLYQGGVLTLCGAALWAIGRAKKRRADRWYKHWRFLGAGFVYIGIDEWASIHEISNQLFDLPGVFYFGWIIPYGLLAAACAVFFVPFVRALPPPVRTRFVVAGAIYVAGALGMELPLGWWSARHGVENLGYALIDWVEESFEMLGLGLFAATVLELLCRNVSRVRLELTEAIEPENRCS